MNHVPPHTTHTCFCVCHESPDDRTITSKRWAPRVDPVGTITACTKCQYLHSPILPTLFTGTADDAA